MKTYQTKFFMKEAGFRLLKDDKNDRDYQTWENENGFKIVLAPNSRISLKDLVQYVTDQAAFRTRRRIKEKVTGIDLWAKGFVKEGA